MAGFGFGSVGGFTKGPSLPKPAAPKAPVSFAVGGFTKGPGVPKPPAPQHGVGAGLNTPSQIGAGAGLIGLRPAPAPPGFSGYGKGPTSTPQQTQGAANSGGAAVSPYDSTYYQQLAAATKTANDSIAGYQQQIGDLGTNLQSSQQNLAHALALATQNAQYAENARGGFAQGALGQQLGNISYANQAQGTALLQKYQGNVDKLNTAITMAGDGLSTEQIALGLASAARQSALVANSQGTLGTNPPAPSGGGAGGGGAGSAPGGPVPTGPPKSQGVTRSAKPTGWGFNLARRGW